MTQTLRKRNATWLIGLGLFAAGVTAFVVSAERPLPAETTRTTTTSVKTSTGNNPSIGITKEADAAIGPAPVQDLRLECGQETSSLTWFDGDAGVRKFRVYRGARPSGEMLSEIRRTGDANRATLNGSGSGRAGSEYEVTAVDSNDVEGEGRTARCQ